MVGRIIQEYFQILFNRGADQLLLQKWMIVTIQGRLHHPSLNLKIHKIDRNQLQQAMKVNMKSQ